MPPGERAPPAYAGEARRRHADAALTLPTLGIAVTLASANRVNPCRPPHPPMAVSLIHSWAFGGDADAARSILSSLAAALITVTSLMFSHIGAAP
jgi:uncharacterized membrane protein